ncbi:MAG: hypothetical protein ACI936_000985 [Paraglaciecola sp.]|jgi:hypothetical protein
MSEKSKVKIESAESVALELAIRIADIEKLASDSSTYRQKSLDLYKECLEAARGHRD